MALPKPVRLEDLYECVIYVDSKLLETQREIPFMPSLNSKLKGNAAFLYASSSKTDANVIYHDNFNQFLSGAHEAFDKHWPFVLAPQHLFLLILHAIILHVQGQPEMLRRKFVIHDGLKDLVKHVDSRMTHEKWESVVEAFRELISEYTVPDTAEMCSLRNFSCCTDTEGLAGDIALMDMCKSFFRYKLVTRCGIPAFAMEGTQEDWKRLRFLSEKIILEKTAPSFSSFWLPILLPTLDKLVEARCHPEMVDVPFWNSFFKRGGEHSSGTYVYIGGWVNVFFPIDKNGERNQFCEIFSNTGLYLSLKPKVVVPKGVRPLPSKPINGLDVNGFTSGVSSVPLKWQRFSATLPMKFNSGFACSRLLHGICVRPEVEWWITGDAAIDEDDDEATEGDGATL